MPIELHCTCGHHFEVPEHKRGAMVECAMCQKRIFVPSRPGAPEEMELAAGGPRFAIRADEEVEIERPQYERCPQCDAELEPGALVCTACGFDLTTGERIGSFRRGILSSGCYNRSAGGGRPGGKRNDG